MLESNQSFKRFGVLYYSTIIVYFIIYYIVKIFELTTAVEFILLTVSMVVISSLYVVQMLIEFFPKTLRKLSLRFINRTDAIIEGEPDLR